MNILAVGKMKLFILALFALIVAVSSESENAKTETVKEQKTDNSALYGKYVRPLNYDVNQRYGSKQEYNNYEGLLRNYYNRIYDYDDERDYYRYRNEGKSYISGRPSYYDRNYLGYSRNVGEKGRLLSYRGEQNVYDNSRYSEGRFRNMNGKFRQGYVDMRYRNKGYEGYGNIFQNRYVQIKPEYIRYVGNLYAKGYYDGVYPKGYYGDGYSKGYYGDGNSNGYYGNVYSKGYYGDVNSRGYYGDGYSNGYYGNVNSKGYYGDGYSKGYYGDVYPIGYYDGLYSKGYYGLKDRYYD